MNRGLTLGGAADSLLAASWLAAVSRQDGYGPQTAAFHLPEGLLPSGSFELTFSDGAVGLQALY